ncbi:DNA-binding protein RFX7 [Hetaerina americana]|uniref:DNA-binding protein RFX7 n=1 Tax=Hetaerina americana TaxID=62018 RepID=UPI003A7F39B8
MDGPQVEPRAQERVAAGKGIKKEEENSTEGNLNASENSMCTTSIPERSRADVSLSDRSRDKIIDNDASVNASNGFHDECSGENSDSLDVSYLPGKANKIQQIVEDATSPESKEIVTKILEQVQQLSVSEKLLLYLKLPTGSSISVDPLTQPINPLGSRFEIQQTITWIKTHLEEDPDVSLPKQEVYDEYLGYCNNNAMKPLSTADFGKVMKQVFPRVRPRRLGTRGNSRYCYSGLRKRMKLSPPLLPDLGDLSRVGSHKAAIKAAGCIASGDEGHQGSPEQSGEDMEAATSERGRDVELAVSHLIREWAEKVLGVHFTTLPELAQFLVKNLVVDGRSEAAFTLFPGGQQSSRSQSLDSSGPTIESDGKCTSPRVPLISNLCKAGGKHREAQLQLTRKLHEKEILREQKRKFQDQLTAYRGGAPLEHLKSQTGKKAKLGCNYSNHLKRSNSDESSAPANKICYVDALKPIINADSKVSDKCWGSDRRVLVSSGKLSDSVISKPLNKEHYIKFCQDANVSVGPSESEKIELPAKPNGEMQRPKSAAITSASFDGLDANCNMEDYKHSASTPRSQSVLETMPSGGMVPASSLLPQSGNAGKMLIPRLPPSKVSPCKQMTNIIIIPPVAGCTTAPPPSVTPKPRKKYKRIQPKQSPDGSRGKGSVTGNVRRTDRTLGLSLPSTVCEEFSGKEVKGKKVQTYTGNTEANPGKTVGLTTEITAEDNALLGNMATLGGINDTAFFASLDVDLASTSSSTGGEMMSIPCLEKDALDDCYHESNSQEEELMRLFQNSGGKAESSEKKEGVKEESSEISCVLPSIAVEESNSMVGGKTKLSQLRILLERNLATTNSNTPPTLSRNTSIEFSSATSSDVYVSSHSGRSESVGGRTKPVLPPLSSLGFYGTQRRVSFETPVQELHSTSNPISTSSSHIGMQASIPPSPNTRRQIFSFTPISPGHDSPGTVGLMPNVPTSSTSGNSASPFVSPRGTPIPRSRHDSGQTSGAMSTPFVSPQVTTIPLGRARHSSSGGMQAVRGIPNGSSQALSQQLSLRPRHSSGTNVQRHGGGQFSPGGVPLTPIECSTESNLPPPSPLQHFVAPSDTSVNSRARHGSASSITPVSPGSAPHSPVVQSCSTQHTGSFLDSEPAAKPQGLLQAAIHSRPGNSHCQYRIPNTFGSGASGHSGDHQRQRHVSAGTTLSMRVQNSQVVSGHRDHDEIGSICSPSSLQNPFTDPLGQEVSRLLSEATNLNSSIGSSLGPPPLFRSQSVPLHRMEAMDALGLSNSSDLPNLSSILTGEGFGNSSSIEGIPSRSHPTTPLGIGQRFGFSMESATSSVAPTPVPSEFADFGCIDAGGASSVLEGIGVAGGDDSMDNRAGEGVAALEGADDSHLSAILEDITFFEGQQSVAASRQFSSRSYPNTPVPDVGVAAALSETGINVEETNNRRSYGDAMLASRSYPSTPLISAPSLPLFEPTLNALNTNPSGTTGGFSAQRNMPELFDQSQVESLEALLECGSEFSQLVQEVNAVPEG